MKMRLRSALKKKTSVDYWQKVILDLKIFLAPLFRNGISKVRTLIDLRRPVYTIWIPLESVDSFVKNEDLQTLFEGGRVRKPNIPSFFWPGDWDRKVKSLDQYKDQSISYRSVFQILNDGKHYKECDEYHKKMNQIKANRTTARGDSAGELEQYFEELISIAESIRVHGYQTQKKLDGNPEDEIGVFIGRNGEIIKPEDKFSGTHRFAIAKCLGIEKVCVQILAVHNEWANDHLHLLTGRIHKLEKYFN